MDIQKIIDTWRGPLIGLLVAWGASRRDAFEIAQDALVEAYLGRDRLQGNPDDPAILGPWLRGIARNLFRANLRKTAHRQELPMEDLNVPVLSDSNTINEDVRLDALRSAMLRLPEKHRQVLCVYYLEECSLREAAGLLDISESTLEGRLYQARKALRAALPHLASQPKPEDRS